MHKIHIITEHIEGAESAEGIIYIQEGQKWEEEVLPLHHRLLLFSIIQGMEKIKGVLPGLDQRQAQGACYLYIWICVCICVLFVWKCVWEEKKYMYIFHCFILYPAIIPMYALWPSSHQFLKYSNQINSKLNLIYSKKQTWGCQHIQRVMQYLSRMAFKVEENSFWHEYVWMAYYQTN